MCFQAYDDKGRSTGLCGGHSHYVGAVYTIHGNNSALTIASCIGEDDNERGAYAGYPMLLPSVLLELTKIFPFGVSIARETRPESYGDFLLFLFRYFEVFLSILISIATLRENFMNFSLLDTMSKKYRVAEITVH